MQKISTAAWGLLVVIMLTLASCAKKPGTAEFIDDLKGYVVKTESLQNATEVPELQQTLSNILAKYAESKDKITPEQQATIADLLTESLRNLAPLSLQAMFSPDQIPDLVEAFHSALAEELEASDNLGDFIASLQATM